jgi:hypothetical protein
MFRDKLVKDLHKVNGLPDWDSSLNSLWRSDEARPWDTYSKEAFRRFWDIRTVEHRTK